MRGGGQAPEQSTQRGSELCPVSVHLAIIDDSSVSLCLQSACLSDHTVIFNIFIEI